MEGSARPGHPVGARDQDQAARDALLEQAPRQVPTVDRAHPHDPPLAHGAIGVRRRDAVADPRTAQAVERAGPVIARVMAEAAGPALALSVPLDVEVGSGPSWGAAH